MKFLIAIILSSISLISIAQNSEVFAFPSQSKIWTFIDSNGKTLFELPKEHKIFVKTGNDIHSGFDLNKLSPFNNGICLVSKPDHTYNGSYYWINKQGELLREFEDNYKRILPFADGYAVAKKQLGDDIYYIYLDTAGNEAFNGQFFLEAKDFKNGIALVKSNYNGHWTYINKKGEAVVDLNKSLPNQKFYVTGEFKYGMIHVKSKDTTIVHSEYEDLFLDKNGKVIININKIFTSQPIERTYVVAPNLITVVTQKGTDKNFYAIDYSGKIIISSKHWMDVFPFLFNGQILLSYKENDSASRGLYLLDSEGNKNELLANDIEYVVSYYKVTESYIVTLSVFSITKIENSSNYKHKSAYFIHSYNDELLSKFSENFIDLENDFYATKNNENNYKLWKIGSEKPLWESDLSEIIFKSIDKAFNNKNFVHHLELSDISELDIRVSELKELESLEISNSDLTVIPDENILPLKKMKELKLYNLNQLEHLPQALPSLINLTKLIIIDCPSLSNMLPLLKKVSQLEVLELENIEISDDFEKELKKSNPNLKILITSSFSMGFDFD